MRANIDPLYGEKGNESNDEVRRGKSFVMDWGKRLECLVLTMCYKPKSTIDSDLHLGLKQQNKTKQKRVRKSQPGWVLGGILWLTGAAFRKASRQAKGWPEKGPVIVKSDGEGTTDEAGERGWSLIVRGPPQAMSGDSDFIERAMGGH